MFISKERFKFTKQEALGGEITSAFFYACIGGEIPSACFYAYICKRAKLYFFYYYYFILFS